ncbi:transcription factor Opi1 [Dipodascopsis uninucleata]
MDSKQQSPEPLSQNQQNQRQQQSELLNRMSNYTIVSSALKAYESGKAYSRGFRYGAEMVESVARPVVRRFEPLEDFALRQLDRLERKSTEDEKRDSEPVSMSARSRARMNPHRAEHSSRWHNVITGASGLGVALSDESLKNLRYCLRWLKYANTHLEQKIVTLNNLLTPERASTEFMNQNERQELGSTDGIKSREEALSESQHHSLLLAKVAETRADIVNTIRRVVSVISTYAGAALPEPARSHVRQYVLALPSRWAAVSSDMSDRSRSSSISTPWVPSDRELVHRVMILATEALQTLGSVTLIVGDTLDRAEGWCNRLGRRQPEERANLIPYVESASIASVAEDHSIPSHDNMQMDTSYDTAINEKASVVSHDDYVSAEEIRDDEDIDMKDE